LGSSLFFFFFVFVSFLAAPLPQLSPTSLIYVSVIPRLEHHLEHIASNMPSIFETIFLVASGFIIRIIGFQILYGYLEELDVQSSKAKGIDWEDHP
jgi:hypothetical protein